MQHQLLHLAHPRGPLVGHAHMHIRFTQQAIEAAARTAAERGLSYVVLEVASRA